MLWGKDIRRRGCLREIMLEEEDVKGKGCEKEMLEGKNIRRKSC